jgi:hypothetical protein
MPGFAPSVVAFVSEHVRTLAELQSPANPLMVELDSHFFTPK